MPEPVVNAGTPQHRSEGPLRDTCGLSPGRRAQAHVGVFGVGSHTRASGP
jgi:hypothetical protein